MEFPHLVGKMLIYCLFTKDHSNNRLKITDLYHYIVCYSRYLSKLYETHGKTIFMKASCMGIFFYPGSTTVTQLLYICAPNLDEHMEVHVVYLDTSKAFDKVYKIWHKDLIFKMKQFGIQENMLGFKVICKTVVTKFWSY